MSLRFRWNGKDVEARPGDSIAAALAAAGQPVLGHRRNGAARGVFCGMGVCQDCLVSVDGRTGQRACMIEVRDGMEVRGQSDASTVPGIPAASASSGASLEVDVAIVGGGPAGLNAALAAAEAGLDAIVLDERGEEGGQYYKPRSAGYRGISPLDAQHRAGERLRASVGAAGIRLRRGETVWFARRDAATGQYALRCVGPEGQSRIAARAVILAAGAYELPAIVPGWTLPGVMTIGAGQTLVRRYGVLPGTRVLVAGHGPLGLQLAAEIVRAGGSVVAVADRSKPGLSPALVRAAAAAPGLVGAGLSYLALLRARGVPVLWGHELLGASGRDSVERARVGLVAGGGEASFDVDAICAGDGFAPQLEIARLLGAGVQTDPMTGAARILRDAEGATDVPGLWVAGDAGGLRGARVAELQGALAGRAAARLLGRAGPAAGSTVARSKRANRFQDALWSIFHAPPRALPGGETVVCRCEQVSASRIAEVMASGARDPGAIKRETRAGMGRCQGRYCLPALCRMLSAAGEAPDAAALFAPQVPVKPVVASALLDEKPEWGGHRESLPSARPSRPRTTPLAKTQADLVVVGSGITGISAALFAARQGAEVVVLDRGRINAEASGGNAGSLHLQLLSWDFGGKAVGGGSLQLRTLPLQKESIALWRDLETELSADFELRITGGLMVAESTDQIDFLEAKAAAELKVGIETEVIGADRIRQIAPAISERMVAAAWCPGEGKINPLTASVRLARAARDAGAVFEENAPVTAITRDGSGYIVATPQGAVRARRIVLAAGGWSAQLGRMLGAHIPVRGAPLQMVVTETAAPLVPCLVAHADRHLTMKQTDAGTILIGGAWTATTGPDGQPQVLPESLEGNLWVAARTVPAVAGLSVVRSWAAMNIDLDGAPLIGALPGHDGIAVAATANGYTLGPLMGREVADMALHGRARQDLIPFSFGRFD